MIHTNVWMKLLTTVLLAAATAFAQSPDRLPVTDAEKIADALRAGPDSSPRTRLCSIGRPRLEANTGFFVKAPTNGPVSRVFPGIRTMSQGVSTRCSCNGFKTAWPAVHRALIVSASRTCTLAHG